MLRSASSCALKNVVESRRIAKGGDGNKRFVPFVKEMGDLYPLRRLLDAAYA